MKMNYLNSRRSFIKKMTGGVALSTIAFSSSLQGSLKSFTGTNDHKPADQKPVRIGIIGGSISAHTFDYGKLFNIDKKFPGVELLYAWADTEEFARAAVEKAKIPNIVKDPNDMLGKIDALIINHRDGRYHLKPAIPFIKAKIPTFIDKPFCSRVSEGKEFLSLARASGTPVSSWSTAAHNDKTADLKKQAEAIGQINNIVSFGPVDIESPWGGVFFYGVHSVDPLLYIFGDNTVKVRVSRQGRTATASMIFKNGMLATIIFMTQTWDTGMYAETNKGLIELKTDVQETDPPKYYVDMVDMFRTGKEPRRHESILHSMAVLEALEKSISSDAWEKVTV
jgi:predicted dehydrogenase